MFLFLAPRKERGFVILWKETTMDTNDKEFKQSFLSQIKDELKKSGTLTVNEKVCKKNTQK